MSIFDSLNPSVGPAASAAKPQSGSFTFVFNALPESADEMRSLPEASLDTPYKTAALTVCALCAYAAAPAVGTQMLNFLKGPCHPMRSAF